MKATTKDIRTGQVVRYAISGDQVVKRVTARNINDLKRVVNMRCEGQLEILGK